MVTSLKVKVAPEPHASVAVAVANEGVAGHEIVDGAGKTEITGAVLSITLIVCEAVEEFPQASTAVHVLVTEYDPAHAPLVVTSLKVKLAPDPQATVAVAVANEGVAGQEIVDGAGNAAITGALVFVTVMVCEAVEEFPQASTAVHVLVTEYDPAQAPLVVTSLKLNVAPDPQASVAVAVANEGVAGQEIVDGAGKAAIAGAVLSITLIVCEAVDEFPQASTAVHVLVTEYDPAQAPLVVTSLKVKVAPDPQASVAVAVANEGVAGHEIVDGAGKAAITGAAVSVTVIVCEAVEEFPQASVAVHVLVTE